MAFLFRHHESPRSLTLLTMIFLTAAEMRKPHARGYLLVHVYCRDSLPLESLESPLPSHEM